MTASPCIAEASSITATEAASTSPSSTPNAWPRRASSPPSAVSAIATTTRWPKTINGLYKAEVILTGGVDRLPRSGFRDRAVELAALEPLIGGLVFNTLPALTREPIGNITAGRSTRSAY